MQVNRFVYACKHELKVHTCNYEHKHKKPSVIQHHDLTEAFSTILVEKAKTTFEILSNFLGLGLFLCKHSHRGLENTAGSNKMDRYWEVQSELKVLWTNTNQACYYRQMFR